MQFKKQKEETKDSGSGSSQLLPPAYDDKSTSGVIPTKSSSPVTPPTATTAKSHFFLSNPLNRFSKRIRASTIPQWTWSNSQCREWLTAALIEYCNRDPIVAKELADDVFAQGGFGPTFYLMKCSVWKKHLGEWDGNSIYSLLLGLQHEKGAVPKNLKLNE